MSNKSKVRTTLHCLAAVHFWFGCYYDWNYVNIPSDVHRIGVSFGNTKKLKFLTFWDALLQAFFYTICVLNDVIGSNEIQQKKRPFIRSVKDLILTCLAFPLSMFVGLTFWGLYAADRELVFPKAIDPYFPSWLNHVMHTNIMLFILVEMCTCYARYPTRKVGIAVLMSFMASYLVWIHVIHAYSGIWVYPVLDVLNLPGRVVFFLGLLGLCLGLYVFGEKLHKIVWRKSIGGQSKKHK